jgi:hypothetical protein
MKKSSKWIYQIIMAISICVSFYALTNYYIKLQRINKIYEGQESHIEFMDTNNELAKIIRLKRYPDPIQMENIEKENSPYFTQTYNDLLHNRKLAEQRLFSNSFNYSGDALDIYLFKKDVISNELMFGTDSWPEARDEALDISFNNSYVEPEYENNYEIPYADTIHILFRKVSLNKKVNKIDTLEITRTINLSDWKPTIHPTLP